MTDEKLNMLPKDVIIMMLRQQENNFQVLSSQSAMIQKQNEQLLKQIEDLNEKIAILTMQHFGKKSEKNLQVGGQLSFDWDNPAILNEAELITEAGIAEEPQIEQTIIVRRRPKGKRAIDLKNIETVIENHYIDSTELNALFPNGWHQLDDEVYTELHRIPASYEVKEHHIGVYAGNGSKSKIIRGEQPNRLLNHSILTPSLAASVFSAKFVNAMPYNRISEAYNYDGVNISRQVIAGWMIKLYDYYLKPIHEAYKKELLASPLIHCDESPFTMSGEKDENDPKSKHYMWVYHAPYRDIHHPVYLYEYDNGSRSCQVIRDFLAGYKGVLITDGYQSYHTLQKERAGDLIVAGCWAHARRKFADIIKATKKGSSLTRGQQLAQEAIERIAMIYHVDNTCKDSSAKERLKNRKQSVRPLVDDYFAWVKENLNNPALDRSSALRVALNYSVNQEKYLRTFLENGDIPLDNNDAERSIKKFCVGKHSWHIIESKNGAKASAMLYSIAETAKANGVNPYAYFEYLMDRLKDYPRNDVPKDVIQELMPWSPELPDKCRKMKR